MSSSRWTLSPASAQTSFSHTKITFIPVSVSLWFVWHVWPLQRWECEISAEAILIKSSDNTKAKTHWAALPKSASKDCRAKCMVLLVACFPVFRMTSSWPTSQRSKPVVGHRTENYSSQKDPLSQIRIISFITQTEQRGMAALEGWLHLSCAVCCLLFISL